MVEELLSFAILLKCDIVTLDKYNDYLNEIYLQHTDNDLLLELQWCSSDSKKTIDIILEYTRECEIDYNVFGRVLFAELELVYKEMDINNFGVKTFSMWKQLPKSIQQTEPFWTLSYADDPLSYGDEKLSHELYGKMFKYYK